MDSAVCCFRTSPCLERLLRRSSRYVIFPPGLHVKTDLAGNNDPLIRALERVKKLTRHHHDSKLNRIRRRKQCISTPFQLPSRDRRNGAIHHHLDDTDFLRRPSTPGIQLLRRSTADCHRTGHPNHHEQNSITHQGSPLSQVVSSLDVSPSFKPTRKTPTTGRSPSRMPIAQRDPTSKSTSRNDNLNRFRQVTARPLRQSWVVNAATQGGTFQKTACTSSALRLQ